MSMVDAKRILEAVLLCVQRPLAVHELVAVFNGTLAADDLKRMLEEVQQEWSERGLELVDAASGWRFQSQPKMREYLDRLALDKPSRYSRATLETLAVIAYRQPVTRGEIEAVRGVTINNQLLKQLADRDWIKTVGHRETVGRPALYATTPQFLDDLGIDSLVRLPLMDSPLLQSAKPEDLD